MRQLVFIFIIVFLNGCGEPLGSHKTNTKTVTQQVVSVNADSILERHFEAMGGRSKLEQLKYIHQEFLNVVEGENYHVEMWSDLGHRSMTKVQVGKRQTIYYSMLGYGFGAERSLDNPDIYEVFLTQVGNSSSAKELHGDTYYGNFDILLRYKEHGISIHCLDTVNVKSTYHRLLVNYPDSSKMVLVVDTASHMVISTATFRPGEILEKTARFSDFEWTTEGFFIPKRQVYSSEDGNGKDGWRYHAELLSYYYSTKVPDGLFEVDKAILSEFRKHFPKEVFPVELFERR